MMMVIFYKFNLENTSDNINSNIIKTKINKDIWAIYGGLTTHSWSISPFLSLQSQTWCIIVFESNLQTLHLDQHILMDTYNFIHFWSIVIHF